MLGDTAQMDPFQDFSDYGKGVYIYHLPDGVFLPAGDQSVQDMECADGYWNWVHGGTAYQIIAADCFRSPLANWNYYLPTTPRYDNDASIVGNPNLVGDGASFHYNSLPAWWGIGKAPPDSCHLGTDRIFTNAVEIYNGGQNAGDRWDAWKPGYNEIFSPYSSPSTVDWEGDTTGIYIWYFDDDHGAAQIKTWRASENGGTTSRETILELTPPSRPMHLRDTACVYSFGQFRPKILWTHNMEPDMNRLVGESEPPVYEKRYKIYRSVSTNLTNVPNENSYTNIATVNINSSVNPYYIDTSVISGCYLPQGSCPPNCWVEYRIRYRVTAVDKYDDESVKSDFAATTGLRTESGEPGGGDEDSPHTSNIVPTEFALQQNYPNPFNPVTSIQYQLPKDVFVSIKLYDIAGREVGVLVNAFKQAGYYLISFNGSELSSGVYFYKIEAGNFKEVKRMVLAK